MPKTRTPGRCNHSPFPNAEKVSFVMGFDVPSEATVGPRPCGYCSVTVIGIPSAPAIQMRFSAAFRAYCRRSSGIAA